MLIFDRRGILRLIINLDKVILCIIGIIKNFYLKRLSLLNNAVKNVDFFLNRDLIVCQLCGRSWLAVFALFLGCKRFWGSNLVGLVI